MVKKIASFAIDYYQYLDSKSNITAPLPTFATDISHLQKLYRMMVMTRVFDTKAILLQRTGKLGTYASSLGHEAVSVGIGFALKPDDVFCASYRDYATQLLRGVTMAEILGYWSGSEKGNAYQAKTAREDLPNCIPIGSQCLHAAGIATAFKLRGEARAVAVTAGDGATSQGDFYESINIAGVWQLPLVIIIVNNQWAISLPRDAQTAAKTLAQKGIAGGIPVEQIDGNDVIAVEDRVSTAIARAREGKGPTLIEAVTYRLSDHTTADDASRYRRKEELSSAFEQEPVARLRQYLFKLNAWSEKEEIALQQSCTEEVTMAVENYPSLMAESPENIFLYQYAQMPSHLQKQRADFLECIQPRTKP